MSEQVTSFIRVEVGDSRYLFFLVTWNDFVTPITEELQKQREPFGEALGLRGSVIQAFKSARNSTFNQVVAKQWPQDIVKRMKTEQDPFMLIINQDFREFKPEMHPWGIVWFSDFWEKSNLIYRVFGALAQKVRGGEDVLGYLATLSRQGKYKKLTKYLEIKPGLWGVAIDVKALLDDLLGIEDI